MPCGLGISPLCHQYLIVYTNGKGDNARLLLVLYVRNSVLDILIRRRIILDQRRYALEDEQGDVVADSAGCVMDDPDDARSCVGPLVLPGLACGGWEGNVTNATNTTKQRTQG